MTMHEHSFGPVQLMSPLRDGTTHAQYQQALVVCPGCGATKVVQVEYTERWPMPDKRSNEEVIREFHDDRLELYALAALTSLQPIPVESQGEWVLECRNCQFTKRVDSVRWADEARSQHEATRPEHNVWLSRVPPAQSEGEAE